MNYIIMDHLKIFLLFIKISLLIKVEYIIINQED